MICLRIKLICLRIVDAFSTGPGTPDVEEAVAHLHERGYAVMENVLAAAELAYLRRRTDAHFAAKREAPFEPEDGPEAECDAAIEAYLAESYTTSQAELGRLMRRIRHTRARNFGTPWPVDPHDVNKTFLHLPTLFDKDKSERVWNLLNKGDAFGRLVEHPMVLELVRRTLGSDCLLSDASATSIGPHTGGGDWHVDVPLG